MKRKSFLAASATVAALAAAACAKTNAGELELVEPSTQFDSAAFSKLVSKPADVRQLWDVGGYQPGILGEIKNALNGYQFGFGIKPARIAMAACLHGQSNAFAYSDAMWQKYSLGAALGFKDPSGNAVTTNIFAHPRSTFDLSADPNDNRGTYQDPTLETLQKRGVIVLVCHAAAAEQAANLSGAPTTPAGMAASDILRDLLAHLIPGALVVPSMVATIGLLQNRYGYAYTTA